MKSSEEANNRRQLVTQQLYSDDPEAPLTDREAQALYNKYTQNLNDINQQCIESQVHQPHWVTWENGLRNLYRDIIHDAFENMGIIPPEGMEIYLSGSLAKGQATPYSDLDAFVLLDNPDDTDRVKPVFEAINRLCTRIFFDCKKLYPDPIGINPARLIGTVDQVFNEFKSDENAGEPVLNSIYTSRPISGQSVLGVHLRNKLKNDPELGVKLSAQHFYETALGYKAPVHEAQTINFKTHIMRPLDFILMGLREEYQIFEEDGSHLSALKTVQKLREIGFENKHLLETIGYVFHSTMALRYNCHEEAQGEEDKIPRSEQVNRILDGVETLRAFAQERITHLQNETQELPHSVDEIDESKKSFFSRHKPDFLPAGFLGIGFLVGTLLGVLLTMSGVFTPLGVGILAIIATISVFAAVGTIGFGIYEGSEEQAENARNDQQSNKSSLESLALLAGFPSNSSSRDSTESSYDEDPTEKSYGELFSNKSDVPNVEPGNLSYNRWWGSN